MIGEIHYGKNIENLIKYFEEVYLEFHQDLTVPLNLKRFKNIKFINKCFGDNNDWQNKFNELAKLPKTQPRNLLGWMRKATTAFL